jgi:nucleoside-diphosphate-sugar epimerase
MVTVLVTGATGYLGSRLVQELISCGNTVHRLVRTEPETYSSRDEIIPVDHQYDGSYLSIEKIFVKEQIDIVLHLASMREQKERIEDVGKLFDANVVLATYLLEAAVAHDCRRMIIAGSYWEHAGGDEKLVPNTIYAVTKISAFFLADYFARYRGIAVTNLILFDTYGPNDSRKKIFYQLVQSAMKGNSLPLTKGEQRLLPIHVDDVVAAFMVSMNHLFSVNNPHTANRYFVPGPESVSLREMVEVFCTIHELELDLLWGAIPYHPGQIFYPYVGPTVPGWSPHISIQEGFKELLKVRE